MTPRDLQAALAGRPQIANTLDEHVRAVFSSGSVDPALKHLCAAMSAAVNFCDPLLVEHRGAARHLGVPIDKLNDLWEFARSERYTQAERAALSAAVALSREPRALPPAVWEALRAHFDREQIVEILSAIGAINYLARVRNAIDTETPASG